METDKVVHDSLHPREREKINALYKQTQYMSYASAATRKKRMRGTGIKRE